jgi:hypothetical protein
VQLLGALVSHLQSVPRPLDKASQQVRKLCQTIAATPLLPGGRRPPEADSRDAPKEVAAGARGVVLYGVWLPDEGNGLLRLLAGHSMAMWDVLHAAGLNLFGRRAALAGCGACLAVCGGREPWPPGHEACALPCWSTASCRPPALQFTTCRLWHYVHPHQADPVDPAGAAGALEQPQPPAAADAAFDAALLDWAQVTAVLRHSIWHSCGGQPADVAAPPCPALLLMLHVLECVDALRWVGGWDLAAVCLLHLVLLLRACSCVPAADCLLRLLLLRACKNFASGRPAGPSCLYGATCSLCSLIICAHCPRSSTLELGASTLLHGVESSLRELRDAASSGACTDADAALCLLIREAAAASPLAAWAQKQQGQQQQAEHQQEPIAGGAASRAAAASAAAAALQGVLAALVEEAGPARRRVALVVADRQVARAALRALEEAWAVPGVQLEVEGAAGAESGSEEASPRGAGQPERRRVLRLAVLDAREAVRPEAAADLSACDALVW